MKVFKFGGASVNHADRIKNLYDILFPFRAERVLIVISAIGKTTNALEKVTESFFEGDRETSLKLFNAIKEYHINLAKELLTDPTNCETRLRDFFTEVEWLLFDDPVRDYDYYYDQVVCSGELMSTIIISQYLDQQKLGTTWVDARDCIRTDDDFRSAEIDWQITQSNVDAHIVPLFSKTNFVLTQGFIGATASNESTTLGREGSDFSSAVFANLLDAESLTIWKDVSSVMNADPKQYKDAVPIPLLSYQEVVEMAYYGAQVIHPKTIRPLQNKKIPLYVKCFLDPALPGTLIKENTVHQLPPIIVLKENQVKLEMSSTDFSFIGEYHVGRLYQLFEQWHIRPNLTQNGAISFSCVLDDHPGKIEKLASEASRFLDISVLKGLSLLTIRHYNQEVIDQFTEGKKILLRQQTGETIQLLMG